MYRKQFLLWRGDAPLPSGLEAVTQIGGYRLAVGPDSLIADATGELLRVVLVGDAFDWRKPQASNAELCVELAARPDAAAATLATDEYFGQFVLLIEAAGELTVAPDAGAQKEVYYSTDFTAIGSQPKLLERVIESEPWPVKSDAAAFYASTEFATRKLYVNDTTDRRNIRHLHPNHLLEVSAQELRRFYPRRPVPSRTVPEVAARIVEMLRGYFAALASRYPLRIGVTGGYDSRILFLASRGYDVTYYVVKHADMSDAHHDIRCARQLVSYFDETLELQVDGETPLRPHDEAYLASVDHPRSIDIAIGHEDRVYVNGNIAEVGRNHFGYHERLTARKVSELEKFGGDPFAVAQLGEWLDGVAYARELGYHPLDLLYWEQNTGNWAAKWKTESAAMGAYYVTPFNSRALLEQMLSVPRDTRDVDNHAVWEEVIAILCDRDPDVLAIPINDDRKHRTIKRMKRLGVFHPYQRLSLWWKTRVG